MKWYFVNLFCAIDQLVNALFAGWCDETMSSHAYRLHRDGKPWAWLMRLYDAFFFWQKRTYPQAIGHCHDAYLKERARYQQPPEMRDVPRVQASSEQGGGGGPKEPD